MTETFIAILETDDESKMIDLLRRLTPKEKKTLVAPINKLRKEYGEFGEIEKEQFGSVMGYLRGTDNQRALIQMAAFVCFDRKQYERAYSQLWRLRLELLDKVLDWYSPSWFSDYINDAARVDYMPELRYDWVLRLSRQGILQPSTELIVKTLPGAAVYKKENGDWDIWVGGLLADAVTLNEHIWYLFEQESGISHIRTGNLNRAPSSTEGAWQKVLKVLVGDGHLERARVLRETLLAGNRNLSKQLSGWFADIFMELQPTPEELLQLQKELFSVLGAPMSKPVNMGLQAIKTILSEKGFDATAFLDAMPVPLSSDVKSTVSRCLALLEKLAQNDPAHRERIALLVCPCFIHNDEELQSRVAKLILKCGNAADAGVRWELSEYKAGMRSGARQMLAAFLDAGVEEKGNIGNAFPVVPAATASTAAAEIPFPASLDDLVFLASQAFDNNEPWHFELLPAALIHHSPELKAEHLVLLEPAFQRAANTTRVPVGKTGNLDMLLANFFIDFGHWLFREFPEASEGIKKAYVLEKPLFGWDGWPDLLETPASGSYTSQWMPHNRTAVYIPFQLLLMESLRRIENGSRLPLLSTPTHAPCWVDVHVLVSRLKLYLQEGEEPHPLDLQLAISRIYTRDAWTALAYIDEQLTGEWQQLFRFLLDEKAEPPDDLIRITVWIVAALTRKDRKLWPAFESFGYGKELFAHFSGQRDWTSTVESFNRVDHYYYSPYKDGIPSGSDPLVYEYLNFRSLFAFTMVNDIRRVLSLVPHNPEPVLAEIITKCLRQTFFRDQGERQLVTAVTQQLYELWDEPGEMSYLFLGCCLLCGDKPIGNMAAETWIKAVTTGKMDNARLGNIIGLQAGVGFAPLKRVTDLLLASLHTVSAVHDRALQQLLEHMLVQLPDKPMTGLKQLLEAYSELRVGTGTPSPEEMRAKLNIWGATSNLKKVVGGLIN